MTKLLEIWIFVNYCGQKIGQFSGADLRRTLFNALVAQVAPLVYIPVIFLYIGFGFRSFYIWLVLMVLVVWFTRITLKKGLKEHLSISRLEIKYKATSRKRRIVSFVISILFTGGAIVFFGYSLFILKWLK